MSATRKISSFRAVSTKASLAKGAFLTWTSDDNMYASTAIEKMVAQLLRGT
jgi:hypothetical protein